MGVQLNSPHLKPTGFFHLKHRNFAPPRHCTCYTLLKSASSTISTLLQSLGDVAQPLGRKYELPHPLPQKATFHEYPPLTTLKRSPHQCANLDTSLLNTCLDIVELLLAPQISPALLRFLSSHEIAFCAGPHRSGLFGISLESSNSGLRRSRLLCPASRLGHCACPGSPSARPDT